MFDWDEPFEASYRFVGVGRATGLETGPIPGFRAGGSIERNSDTDIGETASAEMLADSIAEFGTGLVRIYLDAVGLLTGQRVSEALGTFIPQVARRDISGPVSTVPVTMLGRLAELADDMFESPYTVPKGTNAVSAAAKIARDCGLTVVADDSAYALSTAWTFGVGGTEDRGSTKLAAVNALLDIAGFSSASTDHMGRVLLRRYVEPAARPIAAGFAEGPTSRFLRQMTEERDTSGVANVVKCVYTTQDATVIGTAVDADPKSPYSTVSRGRRIVRSYDFQDQVTQAEADAKAAELLRTNQSVIRRLEFKHIYRPVSLGDAVEIDYPTGGVSGKFAVRKQTIELGAGCPVSEEAVRYER